MIFLLLDFAAVQSGDFIFSFPLIRSGAAQRHRGLRGGGVHRVQGTAHHGGLQGDGPQPRQKSHKGGGNCLVCSLIASINDFCLAAVGKSSGSIAAHENKTNTQFTATVHTRVVVSPAHRVVSGVKVCLQLVRLLSVAQIKEYLQQEYEKKEGKQRDEAFYQKIMDDIFKKNDQDKDGQISAKEFNIYGHDEL